MEKIKVAQIGTSINSHGNQVWKSLTKQTDVFEVVGYAFPENEREKFLENIDIFDGYREMTVEEILNDPQIDGVVVETEEIYLTKYALMVAQAGKHLHMEKPGGMELADFEKLISILKSKNLVFSTGYMYRFNPVVKEALDKVKNGELGKIYSVEAHMSCKHPVSIREWVGGFPGGMLFFLGCHLIDLIYQIQGDPVEVLPMSCSTGIDGVTSEDYGMVVFKYKNGVSFAKTCDNECGGFLRRQLVIIGEKGTIEIKPLEDLMPGGQCTVMNTAGEEEAETHWVKPWTTTKTGPYDRYDDMLRNFAEMVRGRENPYSYDYELNLYRLVLKACGKEV